jgi:predicted ATPase
MIKEIHLYKWKSFDEAVLFIDPLTILIGANAGGKSNALDSLRFMQRAALGKDLTTSLAGDVEQSGIRGGLEWAALKPNNRFKITVIVAGDSDDVDFEYTLEASTGIKCELLAESLIRKKPRSRKKDDFYELRLFWTKQIDPDTPGITAYLYNEKKGQPKILNRSTSILSQIANLSIRKEITEGVERVIKSLRGIFVLDPIPAHMREYTPFSEHLQPDARNIAGVIAALPEAQKTRIEQTLTNYVKHLPERDIRRIWAEPVGKFNSDAMLYCEEQWGEDNRTSMIDARGMSDGTLRFLAILTALLTRPEKSLLVVEEVDNGLHPSRSALLLQMLREVGGQRNIDVLVTTHNPALLDALGLEMLPFIMIAHRDLESGHSKLTLLEDISKLPKLLAFGPVGKLSSEGLIEQALNQNGGQNK